MNKMGGLINRGGSKEVFKRYCVGLVGCMK